MKNTLFWQKFDKIFFQEDYWPDWHEATELHIMNTHYIRQFIKKDQNE